MKYLLAGLPRINCGRIRKQSKAKDSIGQYFTHRSSGELCTVMMLMLELLVRRIQAISISYQPDLSMSAVASGHR